MKFFLLLLFPMFLFADISYDTNYNRELRVLESFDIEPSFLYDSIMDDMRIRNSSSYRTKYFFRAMNEASLFIPSIKKILSKNNIPQEFLFLAMAESNFSTKAYSSKKAAGLWQFMPQTANIYKLKNNLYVDERRDLLKSTKAASKHLNTLYDKYGKWYLAAIAYNCGDGRLDSAIKKAKSNKLSILLDEEKKYIPKESRDYIRKVVALAIIGSDELLMLKSKQDHLLNVNALESITVVNLPSGEQLSRVAKLIEMPFEKLKKLNRHLKYDLVPPFANEYAVYIPYEKLSLFKKRYFKKPIKKIYKVHIVTSGDSLLYLGIKYGVPYKLIVDFNDLKSSKLRIKQKLIIPIEEKIT